MCHVQNNYCYYKIFTSLCFFMSEFFFNDETATAICPCLHNIGPPSQAVKSERCTDNTRNVISDRSTLR